MALDKLTIIDGGGLSTTSDYRVGVITATKFVGPVEGSITATDATFSGNVSIAGTLTYEDVTNIDSVGIITAQKDIHVGAGVSAIGVGTFSGLDISGDIDVDGHTELDRMRVTGVATFTNFIEAGSVGSGGIKVGSNLFIQDQANVMIQNTGNGTMYLKGRGLAIRDRSNNNLAGFSETGGTNLYHHSGSTKKLGTTATGISIPEDLDVDGHTNLDNVSVAGVSTFSSELLITNNSPILRFTESDTSTAGRIIMSTGQLYIQAGASGGGASTGNGNIFITGYNGQETYAAFRGNGAVQLYHNNIKKFDTTTSGINVTGLTDTDNLYVSGAATIKASALDTDFFSVIRQDHGSTKLFRIFQDSSSGGGAGGCHINTNNRHLMITANVNAGADDGLYLTTAGKLGIGTDNPSNALDVQGGTTNTVIVARSTDAKAQISLLDNSTTSVGSVVIGAEGDDLFLTSGSGGAEALRITSGGHVNIGGNYTQTSYPAQITVASNKKISFYDGSHDDYSQEGPAIGFSRVSDGANLLSGIIGIENTSLGLAARGDVVILTGGTAGIQQTEEAVRITDNGRVLIATTTEGHGNADDLTIATAAGSLGNTGITIRSSTTGDGNIFFSDATSGDGETKGQIKYAHSADALRFSAAGSQRLEITSDGQLNLGSRTATTGGTNTPTHFRISRTDNANAPLITMGAHTYASGNASAPGAVLSANHRDFIITKFLPDFSGNSPGFWLKNNEIIMYSGSSETVRLASNSRVGIGSDVPGRPLSIGAGDGTVALHGGNAGIYIGTHPTGGFQNNCAIARAGANNYHISGSSAGDLCIAGESTKDIIIGTSVSAGAMNERMRFHHDGMVEITGTGSNLALNVGGGYIRCVGSQPTVVAHKSSSTFCHIGVENNSNARAFLAYTNDKDFIIGRRTAYTGDHTGYSGADITIDKTNHAVVLSYNGSQKFTTASDGISVAGSIYNSSSVNSTGDKGIQMGNGHRLGFDQSGTRSWTMKATGGNLNFYSGDGLGLHVFHTPVNISGALECHGITTSSSVGGYLNLQGSATTKILLQGVDGNQIRYRNAAGTYTANLTSVGNGDTFRIQNEKQSQYIDVKSGGVDISGDLYMAGELNLTTDGNKNRFIDSSLDPGEALFLRSTENGDANHQNMALFHREGSVNLYHSNTEKFATQAHGINVYGDIHMGGTSNTSTNQNRQIYWTAFDKEGTADSTDYAYIKHTTNVHGITGSVLEIKAENDATDGIALAAANGNGQIAFAGKIRGNIEMHDYGGRIRPSYGTGDKGIFWQPDPAGGSGDYAHIQYYTDGSGEDTRLRIQIANDSADDLRLEGPSIRAEGSFSSTNKHFRIPHVLSGLTTTTDLIHSVVEGPQADNLYRGRTTLVAGISTVNIDTTNNMTEGTFVNLNRDVQCFTTNETGWTAIKGSVTGNLLTIVAQDNTCTDTISWMVIGERWDLAMYDPYNPMTDANGKAKTEIPNDSYNKGGDYEQDYINQNRLRVGISTFFRPSIENKEVE